MGRPDDLRLKQVERARYEAELARRRFLQVDPEHRLVADSLGADWNEKLRELGRVRDNYERQREEDRLVLDEGNKARIRKLATDFPRLWCDPKAPDRDRKRMVRLLHTEREVARILNERGFVTGTGKRFNKSRVKGMRRVYGLATRKERLQAAGLLTLDEIAARLGLHKETVKQYRREGRLKVRYHPINEDNQFMCSVVVSGRCRR